MFVSTKRKRNMKTSKITFEITNLTLRESFIFISYTDITFDKAFSDLKNKMKSYEFIIENVKCKY